MPIGEKESHPYLDYLEKNTAQEYESILIGSFPIYCISNSTPIEAAGKLKKDNWKDEANYRSFYGGRSNKARELLKTIFNCVEEKLELLLTKNNIIITDAIRSCQRKLYSAKDQDLLEIEMNIEILKLMELPHIKYIYFTSLKSGLPFKLFNKMVRENFSSKNVSHTSIGNTNNQILKICDREYVLGFLDSPSPLAELYKSSNGWKRYSASHSNSTFSVYILEQWTQLILKKNFEYVGSNAIY